MEYITQVMFDFPKFPSWQDALQLGTIVTANFGVIFINNDYIVAKTYNSPRGDVFNRTEDGYYLAQQSLLCNRNDAILKFIKTYDGNVYGKTIWPRD